MRNNDTQHIVRLFAPQPAQTVLPAHAPLRTHHDEEIVISKTVGFTLARGLLGKVATLLLLPMIFIYPLAPLYAADETVTEATTTTPTPAPEITAETPAPVDTTPIEVVDTPTPASDTTTSLVEDLGSALSGAVAVISNIFSGDEPASTTPTTGDESTSSTTPLTDDSGTTTPIGGEVPDDTATTTINQGDASTTPIIGSENASSTASSTDSTTSSDTATSTDTISTESASTTEAVVPQKTAQEIAQEMLAEKEDALRASIRKEVEDEYTKGCVALDTTGYYCLKDRVNGGANLSASNVVTNVTSQPDESGQWKQIFMTRGGVQEQLTHNAWDNAFPTFDVSGKSIVWQGNISGRWQIFYANVATSGVPEITQLTHSNESNFNPKVDGDDVVWQGWVDGNWEIFLAERLSPTAYYATDTLPQTNRLLAIDNSWKVTRITTNSGHDMFPAVAGGLVTWQSFQDNTWNVYVYSIKNGGTQKISSSGEKSEKPRFAITWDERSVDGYARMVGYDIATGKTIDISSEARQMNEESAPYKQPSAPISQPDQAALPVGGTTGAGTSTNEKDDGGDASDTTNGLDV